MPIFEYKCDFCNSEFELLQRKAEDKAECSECGSESVTRKLAAFAAHAGGKPDCANRNICPAAGGHCCSSSSACCSH
ncbi:MAG: zinc ribbon domain-containing protein [Lentisphaerae bacterium]|nr:zinc ribbon domain-containing protein [Lentisphaerota bacterium]MCP4102856.1 zinc ribbon domain-containing protein [Lentisphaerota bacterium]